MLLYVITILTLRENRVYIYIMIIIMAITLVYMYDTAHKQAERYV